MFMAMSWICGSTGTEFVSSMLPIIIIGAAGSDGSALTRQGSIGVVMSESATPSPSPVIRALGMQRSLALSLSFSVLMPLPWALRDRGAQLVGVRLRGLGVWPSI